MSIWVELLLFVIGLVLIVKGGDLFVDAASWIAEVSGIPKFIVGATIVSLATTLPEMIVSVMAAVEGKVDMAVGNAVGSVTANTALIFAIAVLFMTVELTRRQYLTKSVILIASSAVVLLASLTGQFQFWGTIVLFLLFFAFIFENVKQAKLEMHDAEKPEFSGKELTKNLVMFVLGAAGIVVGSRLLVDSGSAIAAYLGVPESIIAVTLVAVGTSLPELVTTITSIIKKQSSLSAGNIIGANIIDLCLILPLCDLVSAEKLPISHQSIVLDMPVCLLVVVTCVLPMLLRQKSSKVQGAVLLVLYIGYLIVLI
ncbi:MAG: calcium/sodium antiporter [Clostridiales bacterium]|nr:calcium/sodium antiporter [Clostridiales bacterium]MDD6935937.1 calcium/sodium antiporter [Clostridiales bacterium]MDY2962016.1 calcium/sodium antiporter [Oscillospiraceae bacterium]